MEPQLPERLVRFCGADCSNCETYQRFLAGDERGVMDPETGYRCCWLPESYAEGRDCPIKACCEQRGILFCGVCDQFEQCARMEEFYAQPGYDALRRRMVEEIERRKETMT
ncbi:MAG: DUF3795 domain-containing protein [Anaerolineae bacterium]